MNYKNTYDLIISSAQGRQKFEHSERHHIVPKCIGGSNFKSNLVVLSYREHFICHWLLIKIYPSNYKLKAAFAKMLEVTDTKYRNVTSRHFAIVKRNLKGVRFPWLEGNIPWNKGTVGLQVAWNKGLSLGPMSEVEREKRSVALKNRYKTIEHHRKGVSPWCAGTKGQGVVKAWNKGIPSKRFQCMHCTKVVGGASNLARWHNDNCRHRPATG